MDWLEWSLNGARDLVLLAAGGGIAWLSGISAAKRTERLEREKRQASKVAERRQAIQSETRRALSYVYELEILIEQSKPQHPGEDVQMPPGIARDLRHIADVIPDAAVRSSIDNFLDVFNAWKLLIEWADPGDVTEDDVRRYQLRTLSCLREVLATSARGESPDTKGAAELESTALTKAVAMDAYWAQQAADEEYFRTGRK